MTHETQLTKAEVLPDMFMTQIGTLPTFLKKCNDGTFNYVVDGELNVGDEIICWPFKGVVVNEIIESRKARGHWSLPSYKDASPTFYKIRIN